MLIEMPNTGLNDISDTTVTIVLVYNKISTIDTHSEISLRAVNINIEADRSTSKKITNSKQCASSVGLLAHHLALESGPG